MKRMHIVTVFLVLVLCSTAGWADQIVLKTGQKYSGRFVRGNDKTVDFEILGRIETFQIADIDRILFEEPQIARPDENQSRPAGDVQASAEPVAVQPAPIESDSAITFPAGTSMVIRTTSAIDTDQNKVGDIFKATLEDPLMAGNRVIVPKGADVEGTIAYARQSGKISGQAELILELTELKFDGRSYVLRTSDYSEQTASRTTQTAKAAGGVAALGAIIGAIAGGGKGAAIGAVSGAAVGTGAMVLTKGPTIKVPSETLLQFKLEHDLVIDKD